MKSITNVAFTNQHLAPRLLQTTRQSRMTMARSCRSIARLMETLDVTRRLEGSPGFSHALGITYDHFKKLSSDELCFEKTATGGSSSSFLKVRVALKDSMCLLNRQQLSLSTYLAMIDDITTWALVLGDSKRGRAGVSVSLSVQRGPARERGWYPGDQVEIQASVRKIGNILGFVDAQIVHVETGEVVCFGSHIKYLPSGSLVRDALTTPTGWPLAKLYVKHGYPDPIESTATMSTIFNSLKYNPESSTATFRPEKIHASLGGPIHGGCQAVLMEMVATEALKDKDDYDLELHSIHVEYMSPPSAKTVELVASALPVAGTSPTVPMSVQLCSGGRIAAQGSLLFTKKDSSVAFQSKL